MRLQPVAALTIVLAVTSSFWAAQPVEAACGTAWKSRKEPPSSILVLRTATGKVEKVGFKRYVAVVMASGEWPTTLPRAVLEAGALATKQYGWYYALRGNHRAGDKNASGRCYDVRDDNRDQLYRPESAEPTDKQKRARDALWGLSLRKRDRLFLTGYRRGSATKCGADATGFKLFARSAKDCAKRLDYDSERILREYFRPGLTFVWAPGTDPDDVPEVPVAPDGPDGEDDELPAPEDVSPAPAPSSAPLRSSLAAMASWMASFTEDLLTLLDELEDPG